MAKIVAITTDAEHATAMARIDALINCAEGPQSLELYELVELVEDYEAHRFQLTMVAAPTAPAPATESKPKKPPLAGRWCPFCSTGLMLEFDDGDTEQCLNCDRSVLISPAVKAARSAGHRIMGFGMYPR